ncbi:MAG TPA: hypothetical protein VIM01_13770 [Dermatophilaceae bacterium]
MAAFPCVVRDVPAGQGDQLAATHEPVLVSLPGWSLVLVGLAVTAVSVWVYLRRSDRIVDPR